MNRPPYALASVDLYRGYGVTAPYATTDFSKEAAKAAKTNAAGQSIASAASGVALTVAAAAVGVAPPFGAIFAALSAAVGGCLIAADAIGKRNQKILRGDQAAIAPFLKRVSRWKADKRKQVATRLLKEYDRHKRNKPKNPKNPWKVRENELSMKLAALYAAEAHARVKPHKPIDPESPTPAQIEIMPPLPDVPETPETSPWVWIGGGVALVAIIAATAYATKKDE